MSECNVQFITAQSSGNGGTDDTCADDTDVTSYFCHMIHLFFWLFDDILTHLQFLCVMLSPRQSAVEGQLVHSFLLRFPVFSDIMKKQFLEKMRYFLCGTDVI